MISLVILEQQFTFYTVLKLISRRNVGDEHSKASKEPSSFQHPKTPISTPPNTNSPLNIIDAGNVLYHRPGLLPIPAAPLPLDFHNLGPLAFWTDLPGRDPTVEIYSPCPLFNQTVFYVFCEGSDEPIYHEIGSLNCHSSPPETCNWTYSSPLVPAFRSVLHEDQGQRSQCPHQFSSFTPFVG